MSSQFGYDIYDLDQVLANFFGNTISDGPGLTGAATDGFIKIKQDGPSFKFKKGGAGRLVRSKTYEPLTYVEVHLLQTSKKNGTFSTVWNADLVASNGAGVGTCVVKDLQGTSFFKSERCCVAGPPDDIEFGPEAGNRVWIIACALVDRFDGGN